MPKPLSQEFRDDVVTCGSRRPSRVSVPGRRGETRQSPAVMVYSGRPVLETLPQCRGTNVCRPTPQQHAELLAFVAEQYEAGRSLREFAAATGHTQTAVRRALDEACVPRRPRGAYRADDGTLAGATGET